MIGAADRERLRAVQGRVHSVETLGTLDGPGLRYVLFLQGCPLNCLYCHNPDAIGFSGGSVTTAGAAVDDLLRYRRFTASGGVTLTGGEPLAQPRFAEAILRLARDEGIHTAVDTSGGMPLSACRDAIDAADLLLLDIKGWDHALCEKISGRGNEGSKAMLEYRESVGAPVWIRHVIVPGYTLDDRQLEELAEYVSRFRCVERVELLPFHKMGEFKWSGLQRAYELGDTPEPTAEDMKRARAPFLARGLVVR
ncbi:MAG: pyruvate formate lyase-activating protein [Clostridia bacterium]|nr:pyruvate formate lyase-activating protein [Clostridia bacterium]